MPPKKANDASKKTIQKQKAKIVEDKTFGMKNKNKSKKVQQTIASIERNVMNSGDPKVRRQEEQRKAALAAAKERKKQLKEEQDALFGAALLAVQKKSSVNQKDGKQEAAGRDANAEDGNKKATSRAMKMMYQMDAQEMEEKLREDPNYVPTLEDEIEMKRQQKVLELKKSGKPGTPVTPETFAAWQERKRKARQERAKKLVEAELKKKKGGKGLAVLSGRDLYEYKRDLFQDRDDDATDGDSVDGGAQDNDTNGYSRQESAVSEENGSGNEYGNKNSDHPDDVVDPVAKKVQEDLFLDGGDDDLDDLEED